MSNRKRLLILGGTRDAVRLAESLSGDSSYEVTISLAGRTSNPATQPAPVRVGGFGGVDGLKDFLQKGAFDLLVDATHPYAAQMPFHAAAACKALGLPRLRLLRPTWKPQPGDHWIEVANTEEAAKCLPPNTAKVFLSSGHQDIAAFARRPEVHFVVRLIDPPLDPLPLAKHSLILARGPFEAAQEETLFRAHKIEALVSKNSGGAATYGKIAAARALGIAVIMIARPASPAGPSAETLEVALDWLSHA